MLESYFGAFREIRIAPHDLSGDFQSDDAGENEADTTKPKQRRGLIEQIDTERRSADGANARPHRIGRTDRQGLKGPPEESTTGRPRGYWSVCGHRAQQSCRVFLADRPGD